MQLFRVDTYYKYLALSGACHWISKSWAQPKRLVFRYEETSMASAAIVKGG